MSPVIEVRGLCNRFGRQVVHEGLDLDVERGEILALVGGSGTGKSVLLRTLIGLQRPQAGSVRVFGTDVLAAATPGRPPLHGQSFGGQRRPFNGHGKHGRTGHQRLLEVREKITS